MRTTTLVVVLVALSCGRAAAQTAQELKRLTLAYATSDVRLAWQSATGLEVALVGQNLHQRHHLEWRDGAAATELRRNIAVTLTLRR